MSSDPAVQEFEVCMEFVLKSCVNTPGGGIGRKPPTLVSRVGSYRPLSLNPSSLSPILPSTPSELRQSSQTFSRYKIAKHYGTFRNSESSRIDSICRGAGVDSTEIQLKIGNRLDLSARIDSIAPIPAIAQLDSMVELESIVWK